MDQRYLELLSNQFRNIAEAGTEIINLQAILNLPKGTEHFLADIHGEDEAFLHILRNASGNIKRKVNDLYGEVLSKEEKREFCALIYYPEEKLQLLHEQMHGEVMISWYRRTIPMLVQVCRLVSVKYTRSKVNKTLPDDFSYIIKELLHETGERATKQKYIDAIVESVIDTKMSDNFIIAISRVIQQLSIDQLHILGDIYDRGNGAHIIMDTLRHYHTWDIQWGNHDVLWMGAAAGNVACMCNVIRLSLRYANLTTLEDGYGINMLSLATFAMEHYKDDPCEEFLPKLVGDKQMDEKMKRLTAQMHKAITVLQMKAEAELINRHPEWHMEDRKLLERIDPVRGTINVATKSFNDPDFYEEHEYRLTSCNFPTVDWNHPSEYSEDEKVLIEQLLHSFKVSDKLHKHMQAILQYGSMYKVINGNLLYHAAIPLNEDGTMREVEIKPGEKLAGKALMEKVEEIIRTAFMVVDVDKLEKQWAQDYFLYLWCGKDSPLFAKAKMATFERYFILDKETHVEEKGNYFKLRDEKSVIEGILNEFGVEGINVGGNRYRHVINGHVPVHASRGENPIKADGMLMVIDGGFSQPYHKETGISGYTLVYHSRGFELVQHEHFASREEAIRKGTDIKSSQQMVEMSSHRIMVADTDNGKELKKQVSDLKQLLHAYRHGYIKEK